MSLALPEAFIHRLQQIIPAEQLTNCLASFSQPKQTCFRVNTLLSDIKTALNSLNQQGISYQQLTKQISNCYWVAHTQHRALTESIAFRNHWIYIQNPASMMPPLVLAPQPGEKILDLTAAPGSKTLQLAALMNNQGHIAAVEKVKNRFFHLQKNLTENGAQIVKTFLKDGTTVWKHCTNQFDRVLLDAPCSSESRFSLLIPDSFSYWSERKVKEMQRKQKQLLFSAIQCVKPGGTLVYSTCSFAPEENEAVVNRLLKKFPALQIEPITLSFTNQQPGLTHWQKQSFNPTIRQTLRLLPDEFFDGFYLAKLRKLPD